jgi:hypothetical protein
MQHKTYSKKNKGLILTCMPTKGNIADNTYLRNHNFKAFVI